MHAQYNGQVSGLARVFMGNGCGSLLGLKKWGIPEPAAIQHCPKRLQVSGSD